MRGKEGGGLSVGTERERSFPCRAPRTALHAPRTHLVTHHTPCLTTHHAPRTTHHPHTPPRSRHLLAAGDSVDVAFDVVIVVPIKVSVTPKSRSKTETQVASG